jgi:hypothetical protein
MARRLVRVIQRAIGYRLRLQRIVISTDQVLRLSCSIALQIAPTSITRGMTRYRPN